MTNAGDQQQWAESLDDDKLTPEYPPDRPVGVDEYGVTAAEETVPESVADREQRYQPDFDEQDEDAGAQSELGPLVRPDEGAPPDAEKQEVAGERAQVRPGDISVDDQQSGDPTQRDVAQERPAGDVPAEDAAMHLTDPPPMGTAEPGSADVGDYVALEDMDDPVAAELDETGGTLPEEGGERG